MNILIDNFRKQFFDIQNSKMCFSKKILYQYFVVFYPAWDNFSSENILYVEKREKEGDWVLFKNYRVFLEADGHELT